MNSWSRLLLDMCQGHVRGSSTVQRHMSSFVTLSSFFWSWITFLLPLMLCSRGPVLNPHLWSYFCVSLWCCNVIRIREGKFENVCLESKYRPRLRGIWFCSENWVIPDKHRKRHHTFLCAVILCEGVVRFWRTWEIKTKKKKIKF